MPTEKTTTQKTKTTTRKSKTTTQKVKTTTKTPDEEEDEENEKTDEDYEKSDGEDDQDEGDFDPDSDEAGKDDSVGGIQGIITKIIKGPSNKELPKTASAEDVYVYLSQMFSGEMDKMVTRLTPQLYDYAYTIDLSGPCYTAMVQFANSLRTGKPWAAHSKSFH